MYSGEPNKQPNARKQLGVVLTVIQTIVNCVLVVLFIALVCLEINYAVIYSPQSIESSKNVITDNGDMYDLSNATVFLGRTVYPYAGINMEYQPPVTVTIFGRRLTENTDYTVTYNENSSVGTATVVVTGNGAYSGETYATFEITKSTLDECPFVDVAESDIYYDALIWSLKNRIMTGTSQTLFSPDASCSRGEFISLLYYLNGDYSVQSTEAQFDDVDESNPYYNAICWAFENRIIKGYSGEWARINPDDYTSRSSGILMLHRLAGSPDASSYSCPFEDITPEKPCYYAVCWAYANGLRLEDIDGMFSDNTPLTRGEIVYCLYWLNSIYNFVLE